MILGSGELLLLPCLFYILCIVGIRELVYIVEYLIAGTFFRLGKLRHANGIEILFVSFLPFSFQ